MTAAPFQYLFGRRGPLSSTTVETGGFVRSRPGLERPDLELIFAPLLKNQFGRRVPLGHGYTIHVSLLRPESRGRVALQSADPGAKPHVTFNFLEKPADLAGLLSGVRLARDILGARALAPYHLRELAPGVDARSDAALVDFIRSTVATTYHTAGSCRMGADSLAVVDSKLRVHGLQGLRVVDASIMPTVVAAPTNAAAIMIGERGAEFILQRSA
jgi:choline dehydrogenase-like flavoprotein